MSELRLIILILGLLFIGGVFYWEMRRIKKVQSEEFTDANDDVDYANLGISTHTEDDANYASEISNIKSSEEEAVEDIDILVGKSLSDEPVVDDLFSSASAEELDIAEAELNRTDKQEPEQAGELIPLFVVAETGHLPARQLFDVLESLGFRYGDMQIYHHYGIDTLSSDKPLFSLANMHEPGFFEPESADAQIIKGVVLFFSAPAKLGSRLIFELMLDTAQQIAAKMGAVVCDSKHNVLSDNALQQIYTKLSNLDES